ncbi:endonuclease MutS2 [Lewinellaceae bacterium SD302]|nr:endonuclease MutS2 [Lewinellaceae bacterium SD302]
MNFIPRDAPESLEFEKILQLLEANCQGDLGREKIRGLQPMTDPKLIEKRLDEVAEFKQGMDDKQMLRLGTYEDIAEELKMLKVEGYVLGENGLQRINNLLLQTRDVFKFFKITSRQSVYEALYGLIRPIVFEEELLKEIESVIDAEGNIRADASAELTRLRRMISSKEREMERVFKSEIDKMRKKGWLTDNVESFRNGRRVLSVPSEHKRKIRGIIHDESSTGRTAFIEPEAVIEINNDVFDLQQEEKREIYRILRELSAKLRPHVHSLAIYRDLIVTFDVIQAKATLARKLKATRPKVLPQPHLGIIEGRHPLLYLKNKQIGKKTVPFDLQLFGRNRILVLSGPNAGGKSISMKSVGLLQLMFQCGMLVPADAESQMGVFQKLFTDIGDQQSLEDDLSTYSSRLTNAQQFLSNADAGTLVLIDEFGSGTDPKIGGAIAEAILDELHRKKVFAVITTHYSNLKIYAFKTGGIVNGSMHFDKDTLSPTYELQVGRPGSSYAFEIATKSGLPNKVMKYARRRVGKQEGAVDQLLIDLQREKQEAEEALTKLKDKQQTLDNLTRTYEQLHKDLEVRRKRLKLEAKEQALQETARQNKEMEKVVRELREEKNLEAARDKAKKLRENRKELGEQVSDLRESIYYAPSHKDEEPIREGDSVKLRTGGASGVVESIDKKRAIVQVGDLRMTVKLRDLEPAKEQMNVRRERSVSSDINRVATFDSRLDVRGMRYEEVLATTEAFVDRALMSNASLLQIVHGKGSGALKRAVRQKLREYKSDFKLSHPPREAGGEGVTVVELL